MWGIITKTYAWISSILYWPLKQIPNPWVRAVVTWIGHTAFALAAGFWLGYWIYGPLGAAIGGWVGGTFYIGKETLSKWPISKAGLDRKEIDRFMDAEAPFTGLWWTLYFLLTLWG